VSTNPLQWEDPLQSYRFLVLLDPPFHYLPLPQALFVSVVWGGGFQEASGIGADLEVMPYAEGGMNDFVHQLPVRHSYPRITLKRGLIRDPGLWWWYVGGLAGSLGARRDGAIVLMTPSGIPAFGFTFLAGLAAKWTGPSMNSEQDAVAIESLEIAHEGLVPLPLTPPGVG
jgi:phage tail-like protein